MSNVNKKGRNKTARFTKLDYGLTSSDAWKYNSPVATKLLIRLMSIFNGKNNGQIALGHRDAAEDCGCSRPTIAKAFKELEAKGLIECTADFKFDQKKQAREYRLTMYETPDGRPATREFRNWKPSLNEIERRKNFRN